MIDRIPVASSNIVSAGYDPDSQTLEIEFRNGTVYQYYNVDQGIYDQFSQASSKGGFLNTYLRNGYPFSRVG